MAVVLLIFTARSFFSPTDAFALGSSAFDPQRPSSHRRMRRVRFGPHQLPDAARRRPSGRGAVHRVAERDARVPGRDHRHVRGRQAHVQARVRPRGEARQATRRGPRMGGATARHEVSKSRPRARRGGTPPPRGVCHVPRAHRAVDSNHPQRPRGLAHARRITVQPSCLACHGPKDERPAFVKKDYPEDRAYGFEDGDLRGIYAVFVPDTSTGDAF